MPQVLDPHICIVFCEGRPGSLDDLFLHHLIPPGRAFIRPVGGKQAMRAFIEGYLGAYVGAVPRYLGFRDRDFDFEPPPDPQPIRLPGEKPIWVSYRAAVENYLIDADLIWEYWEERKDTPAWQHGPPLSKDEIESRIHESARALVGYQAVRWALASLKPGPRWPELRTTWLAGSGRLPPSLAYGDCLEEAHRLVAEFRGRMQEVDVFAAAGGFDRIRRGFSRRPVFPAVTFG